MRPVRLTRDGILADRMVDAAKAPGNGSSLGDDAAQALALLAELSPDLRGAAILDADGEVLAATDRAEGGGAAAPPPLPSSAGAGNERVEQVHIGTEQGEVFAVRD